MDLILFIYKSTNTKVSFRGSQTYYVTQHEEMHRVLTILSTHRVHHQSQIYEYEEHDMFIREFVNSEMRLMFESLSSLRFDINGIVIIVPR